MKTTEFNIRSYQPEDINSVLAIFDELCPEYFAQEEKQDLIEYLSHKREAYFVVQENNSKKIVGSGGFNLIENNSIARLSWDMIHPNFHGQKLGTFLINFRISKLRLLSNQLKITVRTSQMAYKFYASCGFLLKEIEKDYWAKGFDLYYMELEK